MYDTLLNRYGDISFIMSLPFTEGIDLYEKAENKRLEERIWDRWLVDYPRMTEKNFKPFSQYYREIIQPPQAKDNRSDEEIITDAENILKSFKRSE